MNLPASFKKIKVEPKIEAASNAKPAAGAGNGGDGKGAGRGKKRKNKNGNGNPVNNLTQRILQRKPVNHGRRLLANISPMTGLPGTGK